MRYWWVNHKQTNKEELDGGYIWSPTEKSNGNRNQTYVNLTRTQPGDRVLSFANGEIKAVGVVNHHHIEAPKPSEFGTKGANWTDTGWLVSIDWTRLQKRPRPKDHIDRLRELLPSKHSPIQAAGNGNQSCYLAEISKPLYEAIVEIAGVEGLLVEDLAEADMWDAFNDAEEERIKGRSDIPSTEIEQLVKARRGQGLFRSRLMVVEKSCRLTGLSDPRFLIASHIKPWRDCADTEKLDGNNGLLLSPHVDKLFDGGWISFEDDGSLIIASQEVAETLKKWSLPNSCNTGAFSEQQKAYLRHHRSEVFKGSKVSRA